MNSINEILSTLNPEQLEAANYTGGPCLIIAGAGTGKTKTLTCKVAKLIADGISPSRILAVTFTNKAAQEMRERIEALVPGNSSRVWIHTFHSFAVRILRHNAAALKLNKDFVIYDETEQKKIITLALEEMGVKEAKKEVNYYVSKFPAPKTICWTRNRFSCTLTQAIIPAGYRRRKSINAISANLPRRARWTSAIC